MRHPNPLPATKIADALLAHFEQLMNRLPNIGDGVEWLLPLRELPESERVNRVFLEKYYSDKQPRTLLLGINPGRHGAGVTNVAFTDPVRLEEDCGIPNDFKKREELSAQFVYQVIHAYGGVEKFYGQFFINSVVPFGFVKDGKNYNYYDDRQLQNAMEPFIIFHLKSLLEMGMNPKVCFCLGEGKNFKYLSKLNERKGFFGEVVPLSHPRYIMQYKRKKVGEYLEKYLNELGEI